MPTTPRRPVRTLTWVLLVAGVVAVTAVLAVYLPRQAPATQGAPGECLKGGVNEVVNCTDPTATWRITRAFGNMTMGGFSAAMADGGDICSAGETTTAYSDGDGDGDGDRAVVYCLTPIGATPAEALQNGELTASVGDCLKGDGDTGHAVVPCADTAARWKVTKKMADMTRAAFDSPEGGGALCASGETAVAHWEDERADAFCLAPIN
ncbi:LppU/SCO3897 family protein [Nonomuraea muscovyensis]|uniref:Uncharacterized protein n=1 Tax=Nonomuraea muscovyensis TaxID=1124761 RepID=A0A7X0CBK7_9ACTN|nr:hypothetical protein [Nonomuraea muscovyensis]MBB6350324.1 hypothetical protein [Nonomuraea muscovyensis]